MRRFLLFVCVLLIQGEGFSEDFGLFKNSWNEVSMNKQVSVTYSVYKTKPNPEREEIAAELERLRDLRRAAKEGDWWEDSSSKKKDWWDDPSYTQKELDQALDRALEKYDHSLYLPYHANNESKFERLAKIMNLKESVHETKSFRFLVRSVSYKWISTEYEDWKATLKGEKIRHCAVRVDTNLKNISLPDEAKSQDISLTFFDSDGLKVKLASKLRDKLYYSDSMSLSLSTLKAGAPQKVLFMPDASCGAPVRVKVESVKMKSI